MPSIFDEVRGRVSIQDAITFLGIKPTEQKGPQLRFKCPNPKCGGDNRSLSVNTEKGYSCFAGDNRGDDATALVAHCKGIRQREAAGLLKDHFLTSATEPRRTTAKATGRPGTSQGVARSLEHPVIEMLGIDPAMLEDIDGGYDEESERIVLILRKADGTERGRVGIATRADQVPLLEFTGDMPVQRQEPDELRRMFRVV